MARKPKAKRVDSKSTYRCEGGPWHKLTLRMNYGSSMVFSLGMFYGYYRSYMNTAEWHSLIQGPPPPPPTLEEITEFERKLLQRKLTVNPVKYIDRHEKT